MLTLRLAFRNILRQRRRSILTGLSVGIGYLVCCVAISMSEGSYSNAIRFFTEDTTGHLQVHKNDYLRRPNLHKHFALEDITESLKDVRIAAYSARLFAPGLAYAGDNHAPANIIGVEVETEPLVTRIEEKMTAGKFLPASYEINETMPALVGAGVAELLEVGVGDELILISQGGDGSVANDIFTIVGKIGTRTSGDRHNVYLPLLAAQNFLTLDGRIHEVVVRVNDIHDAIQVATNVQQQLDITATDIVVSPWQTVQASFFRSMESDKRANEISLGIILFIVFIGVLNTVLMSVLERTREFGVLKAIGSRPWTIARLITIETSILSALGLVIGVILSIPLIWWFATTGFDMPEPIDIGGVKMQSMRGEFSLDVFIFPSCIVYVYALLVSIFPAVKAARINPVDAMRST
ncbi:MAG: FtsX-like permease family protein [Pseudomonadales bacterium]|nr:FtsX-like permease family protein [Pseudomonadales bacterium]